MKMTLVLDTDDPTGLEDALTVARLLVRRHCVTSSYSPDKALFSRIELIKFVREYGEWCGQHAAQCELDKVEPKFSGLKECKVFVDRRWQNLNKKS